MVNKKDLRGGAEKMREVAQLLSAWADDLEASGEKKSRKKAAEPAEAVASADVAVQDAEPAEEAAPAADAPVEEAADSAAAARAEIGYEDLRGLLAEKSAAGYRTQVIALINSFGAEKLSGVDPAHFGELWDAAALLGESLSTASGGNLERDEITRNKRAPQCGVAPIEGAGPEVDGDA